MKGVSKMVNPQHHYKFAEGKTYLGNDGHKYFVIAVGRAPELLAVRFLDLTDDKEIVLENREYDKNFDDFIDDIVSDEYNFREVHAVDEI